MHKVLLDTGPLVALLDSSESNHESCVSFLKKYKGGFVSTEAVLTEAMYLLSDSIHSQKACVDFIIKGEVRIVPFSYGSLRNALTYMERYQDTPMDFADASLVVLAEETGIHQIFTLDRRGFSIFRISHKKQFEIFP